MPKSTKLPRITEHFDIFNFELSDERMTPLTRWTPAFEAGPTRTGITLETFRREIPEA